MSQLVGLIFVAVLLSIVVGQQVVPPYPQDPQGSSGRPLAQRFDGAFSLINITSVCATGFCQGGWVNNGRGIIGARKARKAREWKCLILIQAIGHSLAGPDMATWVPRSIMMLTTPQVTTLRVWFNVWLFIIGNATAADVLASGAFYAGGFQINATGSYVAHFPTTSSGIIKTGGKEVRCFQWFNNDNVLRLFVQPDRLLRQHSRTTLLAKNHTVRQRRICCWNSEMFLPSPVCSDTPPLCNCDVKQCLNIIHKVFLNCLLCALKQLKQIFTTTYLRSLGLKYGPNHIYIWITPISSSPYPPWRFTCKRFCLL